MKKLLLASVLAGSASFAQAAPVAVDLTSWSQLTLDFPSGQSAGNWVLGGGNTFVTQTVNADPSMYLNNLNQTSYTIEGSWEVLTTNDNDYMGFVFGYQNSSNFYLFDWKQGAQNVYGGIGKEGMAIKKYEGATGNGLADLSLGEFWENDTNKGSMAILDTNTGASKGWADNTSYDFKLDFNLTSGEFSILVKQGMTELWNVTVMDSTFTAGQFGFYNFSQGNVKYAGFTQEGGIIVDTPEPGMLSLLGFGLLGFYAVRRRQVA